MLAATARFKTRLQRLLADPANIWVEHVPWLSGHSCHPVRA